MTMPAATQRAYLGTALHAPVCGELEVLRDALIVADGDGRISAVHRAQDAQSAALAQQFAAAGTLVRLLPGQYLLPGLVDLHVHAPQWPQLGKALDLPLEDWLQAYTFPLEARYADLEFATARLRVAGRRAAGQRHDDCDSTTARSTCRPQSCWRTSACDARSARWSAASRWTIRGSARSYYRDPSAAARRARRASSSPTCRRCPATRPA